MVVGAVIGLFALLDHAQGSVELQLFLFLPKSRYWCLNEILIYDPEVYSDLVKELQDFFELNRDSVSNPLLLWVSHKGYIRGILIKHGHRLKRLESQETSAARTTPQGNHIV